MTLHRPKGWNISTMTVVFVVIAMAYTYVTEPVVTEIKTIQFSDLSNAEIDAMVAVKAKMVAANEL